ncbi:MAG: HNH/endonuclease VII fold toxin-2 domain-containing protein [Candidatus Thiodiazotropha sp.]
MKEATRQDIEQRLGELSDVSKWTAGMMQQAKDVALEKATEWAEKKAAKLVAKTALKAWLGPIGWAWTAYDVVSTGIEVKDLYAEFEEMQKDIERLKNIPSEVEALKADGLQTSDIADAQEILAKANPCLNAKRCLLVPYSKTGAGKTSNQGCCAGQTPHHVIPKGQFKSEPSKYAPNVSDCPGYDADQAPCICTEGTSHSLGGSHQRIHDAIEPKIEQGADANGELSYGQSRDMSVDATRKAAPNCSKACLKAQLDKYHKKACNQQGDNFNVRAASAKSGTTYSNAPDIGTADRL